MKPYNKNKKMIRNKPDMFSEHANMYDNMACNESTKGKARKLKGKQLIKYIKYT